MDLDIAGRTALVTGGSKGIGLACAEALAAEGCHLHLTARTASDLAAARDAIRARHNVRVEIHPTDLAKPGAARALAEACGDIDILVNNAGAIPGGDIFAVDEARWREAWDLKVFGYVNLIREVYPRLKAKGGGVIVNVIGLAGEKPNFGYVAGSAGNASLMALTRALGGRSPEDGIRVVACNPGLVITGRMETMLRARATDEGTDPEAWAELIPTGHPKPAEPEQIADLVAFLASPRASHVTGTVITIDGGAAAR